MVLLVSLATADAPIRVAAEQIVGSLGGGGVGVGGEIWPGESRLVWGGPGCLKQACARERRAYTEGRNQRGEGMHRIAD